MPEPKVSVIVPVYNVAPYLARCLDSLVGQTLGDIEIICVDDKSTDNSLAILREYAARDARIKIIALPENGGVANARNAGLAAASGEYIGFVDSDDFVDAAFYERLWSRARDFNADIAKGSAVRLDADGRETRYGPAFDRIQDNKAWFSYAMWSAIYRRAMLDEKGIRFPVGIQIGEDTLFLMKAVLSANGVAPCVAARYHYVARSGSLYPEKLSVAHLNGIAAAFDAIIDFMNDAGTDEKTYGIVAGERINFLLWSAFWRAETDEGKSLALRTAMRLYKNLKYKGGVDAKFAALLGRGDEPGLRKALSSGGPDRRRAQDRHQALVDGHPAKNRNFGARARRLRENHAPAEVCMDAQIIGRLLLGRRIVRLPCRGNDRAVGFDAVDKRPDVRRAEPFRGRVD
ncbi:MAG: glycosyltransferase [Rickettsiales bacterium]|jgi:glycosyltransferase involved in cell wall biosynthesis|nr:glycosyltransferase [Rickettsiales bacterium]